MSRLGRRLLLSLATTVLLLGALEVGARVAVDPEDLVMNPVLSGFEDHPTRLWRYRPSSSFQHDGAPVFETNSLGLRDEELASPKPEGTVRLVFFGESTTAGAGVAAHEAYPEVVGRLLRERGFEVDAVNAGTEAHTSWQSSVALAELAPLLEADVVLPYHQLNDFLPTGVVDQANYLHRVPGSDRVLLERRQPFVPLLRVLYRSRAYLLLRRGVLGLPSSLPTVQESPDRASFGRRVPEADRREAWQRMQATCEQAGATLVVLRPVYGRGRGEPKDRFLEGHARSEELPYLDLRRARRKSGLPDPAFYQDGVHPTAAGHAVFAEAIADFLIARQLVGAPAPSPQAP